MIEHSQEPIEKTVRMKVLYRPAPAWEVGANTPAAIPGSHYPDDYAGKVIAVKPLDHEFTPGDLDGGRVVVELDLTDAQVADLSSRKLKVVAGGLSPVKLEDRWGHVATGLRARWGDEAEVEEALSVAATESAVDSPALPVELDFDRDVARLKADLPAMVVHSGAGLYEVGPGKTYSTIQSALDQLWTDQGSASFTASQYIRAYAGTYDENVTPNAALNPDESSGYTLIIEGDPADDRDNITIQPSAGNNAFYVNCDHAMIRHLKVVGSPNDHVIEALTGCYLLIVDDVTLMTAYNKWAIVVHYGLVMTDSTITTAGDGIGAINVAIRSNPVAKNVKITRTGSQGGTGMYRMLTVEGCVLANFTYGISGLDNYQTLDMIQVRNCTIYNCERGLSIRQGLAYGMIAINNIVKDCTYAWYVKAFPEELNDKLGPKVISRNNCYHGYTNFAYDGAATKTYAEFSALDRVDASGDLDATDPLLTDPAGDDFSLAAASPCIRRVPGAGVPYDINGNPYATDRTDIGSVSSGTSSAAPGISAVSVSGNDYTATVTPGGAPNVRVRLMTRSGTEEDEEQRLGSGDVVLTASSAGDHILVAWGCDAAENPIGEPSAPFIVSVPSPVSSGGSMLRRTPHVVTLKRPAVVRDTDNNVASRDYNNPSKTVTIRCLFQTRGGEVSVGDEGQIVPFDSMLYTIEKDIEVNDRIEVALSFYTGNFLVVAVEPKGRVGGAYSHNQVSLQKDGVR